MERTRDHSLDLLRVVSIIMVITIHTSGQYVLGNVAHDSNYYAAGVFEAIVQIGVPLFVMLSGAFMLGRKSYLWRPFYIKHLSRLALPFIVWLPINYIWIMIKGDDLLTIISQGGGLLQLWFIPMLFILYLLTPPLDSLVRQVGNDRKLLWGIASAFLMIGLADGLYDFFYVDAPYPFYPFFSLRYLGYYMMGYMIRTASISKAQRICLILLYLISVVGVFYFASCHGQQTNEYFYHNCSPFIILASLSLFGIFSSFKLSHPNILSQCHPYVMGIFLVHIMVLNIVTKVFMVFMPAMMDIAIVNIPIRVILVFLSSLLIVRALKAMPYLKHTL